MIHIALNHWRTDDWLRLQVAYVRRFVAEPIRLVACVEDIPAARIPEVDEVVEGIGGNHAGKLNLLGHRILDVADDSDTIVFLGATMLPVSKRWLLPARKDALLATITDHRFYPAVQPHPAFCATTVGLWRSLPGDWAPGYATLPDRELRTLPGANLMDRLRHSGVRWTAHEVGSADASRPVSYSIFGGVLYHHGSLVRRLVARGFAEPEARVLSDDIRTALERGEDLFAADEVSNGRPK